MKKPPVVFMFSGQGSQYYHMGRDLFEQQPVFRKWLLSMDTMVRDLSGLSVVNCLYDDAHTKRDSFDRVRLTHPAIFMVEYAMAQTLIETGVTPDYVLGASLGAFAAATIAGCIGLEDALAAVVKQASMIEEHCQPGGMIAILGEPKLYEDEHLASNCEIAAHNFSSHFVVAARQCSLETIESYLRGKGVAFQRLPVTYAFHSQWIDAAKSPFAAYLETLSYQTAKVPIVCCAGACTLTSIPEQHFWRVAREPIRFGHTILHMESDGPYRYVDAGPSGSMATFLKYTLPAGSTSEALTILSPFGRNLSNVEAVRMKLG